MFIYAGLLILVNRRYLPEPIRPGGHRVAALVWAGALFGVFSALTVWQQGERLIEWLRLRPNRAEILPDRRRAGTIGP
jgi:hypothetical protein